MPLYNVQDGDRPMWVIAKDWATAINDWKAVIALENNGETDEPDGIHLVCEDEDIVVWGFAPAPLTNNADEKLAPPTEDVLRLLSDFTKHKMTDGEGREISALQPSDDGDHLMAQFYGDDAEWYPVWPNEIAVRGKSA